MDDASPWKRTFREMGYRVTVESSQKPVSPPGTPPNESHSLSTLGIWVLYRVYEYPTK